MLKNVLIISQFNIILFQWSVFFCCEVLANLTDRVGPGRFIICDLWSEFLCGLHEVYSHIMVSPDLFIYLFIYLFVYESRASVTWSSVVVLVVSLGSSNFFLGDRISS